MPKRSALRITKRTVDARDTLFLDRNLAGFGVRVHTTGRKLYVVQSRGPTGLKRVTLGHHGELATGEARKEVEVSEETLSVDVVADVVNDPGHFPGARQTLELMESEFVYRRHADRSASDDRASAGAMDMWHTATIRAKEILDTQVPALIDKDADARIRDRYSIRLDPVWSRSGT